MNKAQSREKNAITSNGMSTLVNIRRYSYAMYLTRDDVITPGRKWITECVFKPTL